jgi:hypothetical protein
MAKRFDGQHEDEEVLFVFRRHPIVMRRGYYLFVVPFFLGSLPVLIWPDNLNMLYITLIGTGVGAVLFFYHWIGWYFSIFVVTNQRLRQITQKGFFNRSVIDLGISKIQNISYKVPGFTASVFGFGSIVIQTYVGDLYLDKIHHPEKIFNSLLHVVKECGSEDIEDYEEDTA